MEDPAQTVEYDRMQIGTVTSIISRPIEKNIACEVKKDVYKVEKPEWRSIVTDYTTLHKQYLKLSKIKLTCTYNKYINRIFK